MYYGSGRAVEKTLKYLRVQRLPCLFISQPGQQANVLFCFRGTMHSFTGGTPVEGDQVRGDALPARGAAVLPQEGGSRGVPQGAAREKGQDVVNSCTSAVSTVNCPSYVVGRRRRRRRRETRVCSMFAWRGWLVGTRWPTGLSKRHVLDAVKVQPEGEKRLNRGCIQKAVTAVAVKRGACRCTVSDLVDTRRSHFSL